MAWRIMEGITLGALVAKLWVGLAALAGSLSGAWLSKPKTRLEWMATVFVNFFASLFVAPWLITKWFPAATSSSPEVALTYYCTSMVAIFIIPKIIRQTVKKYAGEPAA